MDSASCGGYKHTIGLIIRVRHDFSAAQRRGLVTDVISWFLDDVIVFPCKRVLSV